MSWSIRLLRVKDIDIRVHATFLLIVVWAAYFWGYRIDAGWDGVLFGVVATLLLFACVTLHELGHSLQALRYGIRTRDITLLPIGGVAALETIPEKPGEEFRIAVAGPLVNVVIAAVLIGVGALLEATSLLTPANLDDTMRNAEWSGLLPYLTLANIWLVLFNAIPAFPMDGGRVLRAALATRLGYRKATEIAAGVGQAMALVFGLVGFATGAFSLVVIAVFVWIGAETEGRQIAIRSVLRPVTVGNAMTQSPQVLTPVDSLARAIDLTLSTSQADFPVVDGGSRVVGLFTADDLLKGVRDQPGATVGALMRREFPRATPAEPLLNAQQRLVDGGVRALPVVQDGDRLVGLLALADVGEVYRLLSIRPELIAARRSGGGPGSAANLAGTTVQSDRVTGTA